MEVVVFFFRFQWQHTPHLHLIRHTDRLLVFCLRIRPTCYAFNQLSLSSLSSQTSIVDDRTFNSHSSTNPRYSRVVLLGQLVSILSTPIVPSVGTNYHRHAADPFVKPFGIHRRSRLLLRMLQPTLPPLRIHLHLRTSYPRWYNPSRVVSIVPAASNDTFHSASIRLSIAIPYGLLLSSVAIVFPGTISIKCWRDPSSC